MDALNSIELENVSFQYTPDTTGKFDLFDISLRVMTHEILFILGTNGSGKSTLLKAIIGLITPQSGKIKIFGQNPSGYSGKTRSHLIGYLTQTAEESLCRDFSISELVRLYIPRQYTNYARQKIIARLKGYGFNAKKRAKDLSRGQQQLLALELILARNPKILLLDEPTSALDIRHSELFHNRLLEISETETTILYVTHKPADIFLLHGNVIFLHEGVICNYWKKTNLPDINEISAAYQGKFLSLLGVSNAQT